MPYNRRGGKRSTHGQQKPIDVYVSKINMTLDKFQRNVHVTVGCMEWTIRVDRVRSDDGRSDHFNVTIRNRTETSESWSAHLYGRIFLVNVKDSRDEDCFAREILNAQFHSSVRQIEFPDIVTIDDIVEKKEKFMRENENVFTIVVVMKVTKAIIRLYADTSFCKGNNKGSDVIVRVGRSRFHVHKEYLAIYSYFFNCMFFGNFKESSDPEVVLKEIHADDFRNLLLAIYPCHKPITDKLLIPLTHFADIYDMPAVHEWCENHLMSPKCAVDIVTKFRLITTYHYVNAQTFILSRLGEADEIKKLLDAHAKNNFLTDAVKATLERKLAKAEASITRKLPHAVYTEVAKAKMAAKECTAYEDAAVLKKDDLKKYKAVLVEKFGERAVEGVRITQASVKISHQRLRREVCAERSGARHKKLLEDRRKRRGRKNAARKERLAKQLQREDVHRTGGGILSKPRGFKEKRLRRAKQPMWEKRFEKRFGVLPFAEDASTAAGPSDEMDTSTA